MKSGKELLQYFLKTVDTVNSMMPKYLFVCADNKYKREFLSLLNKEICIVDPIYDPSVPDYYIDFFSLSLCEKVIMASKFSSFAIFSSLIGNLPLIAFVKDDNTDKRYKAKFQYDVNFSRISISDSLMLNLQC